MPEGVRKQTSYDNVLKSGVYCPKSDWNSKQTLKVQQANEPPWIDRRAREMHVLGEGEGGGRARRQFTPEF